MKWTIRKESDSRYAVVDEDGCLKGNILLYKNKWSVELLRVPELNYLTASTPGGFLHATGYVRGVEAAVRLYGKEVVDS